jgi:hypothetical protein
MKMNESFLLSQGVVPKSPAQKEVNKKQINGKNEHAKRDEERARLLLLSLKLELQKRPI